MVVTLEHALELMVLVLTDGFPYVGGSAIDCVVAGEHRVGIQTDVGIQLVILTLRQITVGIGQLGQIAQLSTIINDVGVILCTSSAGKDDGRGAVPSLTFLAMRGILGCLPSTVLANLLQTGDVGIVAQHILEGLAHAGGEVRGEHLDGMLGAEVFSRVVTAAIEILVGIDVVQVC